MGLGRRRNVKKLGKLRFSLLSWISHSRTHAKRHVPDGERHLWLGGRWASSCELLGLREFLVYFVGLFRVIFPFWLGFDCIVYFDIVWPWIRHIKNMKHNILLKIKIKKWKKIKKCIMEKYLEVTRKEIGKRKISPNNNNGRNSFFSHHE